MALVGDSGGIVFGAETHDFLSTVVTEGSIKKKRPIDALVGSYVDRCGVVGCLEERGEGW